MSQIFYYSSAQKLAIVAQALEVTTDYLLDDLAEPDERVLREAFYRKFSQLELEDRERIEQIIRNWAKKE